MEILFARGLVKVLFATETFAMVRFYSCIISKEILTARRVLICPQDALCSLTYGSMMGAASGTFYLENIPKWQVVLDGEVWTLLER